MKKKSSNMDYLQWDVSTTTVADFSSEIIISQTVWDKWNAYKTERHEKDLDGHLSFRDLIK